MTLEEAQKLYVGKRVVVKNAMGKDSVAGLCTFLGHNEMIPSWGIQITIDRTPISNIQLEQLSVQNLTNTNFKDS